MRSNLRALHERIRQVEAGCHRDTPLRRAYNHKLGALISVRWAQNPSPALKYHRPAPETLCIRASTYPSTNGPGDSVPERCYSVIPWYRYAEFKQVSLQIMMEQFLEVPEWDLPAKRRSLKLRVPRVKLTPSRGHHVCLSAFDSASTRALRP